MSAQYRIATVGTATLCLLWAHSAFAWACDGAPGSQASRGKDKPAQSNKRLSRASLVRDDADQVEHVLGVAVRFRLLGLDVSGDRLQGVDRFGH